MITIKHIPFANYTVTIMRDREDNGGYWWHYDWSMGEIASEQTYSTPEKAEDAAFRFIIGEDTEES